MKNNNTSEMSELFESAFANTVNYNNINYSKDIKYIDGVSGGKAVLLPNGKSFIKIDNKSYFDSRENSINSFNIEFYLNPYQVRMNSKVLSKIAIYNDEDGEKSLKENMELYDKWHNKDGRFRILFGPQGADFVSPELLLKIQKIAKERKTKIHMHVQQGDRETYQIEKRYGKRPTAFLQELDYLDSTLIAVHLTDCNAEEAAVIGKSGAGMVVNPASIAIIDGIVCPSMEFQQAGGNVALGSDQAPGNNCHNIIHEMKNVCLFNKIKYSNPEVMPVWRALRMATIEGAKAVGVDDIVGSLEVGKQADFIAVDLRSISMMPVYTYPMRNIVPNLVYSARGNEVVLSVVAGKVIMKDQKLVHIDEEEIKDEVEKLPENVGKRAEKEFFEINGTNAQFMREGKL